MPCMSYQQALKMIEEKGSELGVSNADVARATGLSDSQISRIFSGTSKASDDALVALANAVQLAPITILKIAHDLDRYEKIDPLTEKGVHILQHLEGEELEEGVRQLQLRLKVQEERAKYHVPKRKGR